MDRSGDFQLLLQESDANTATLKVGIVPGGKPHPVAITRHGACSGLARGFRFCWLLRKATREPGGPFSGFHAGLLAKRQAAPVG